LDGQVDQQLDALDEYRPEQHHGDEECERPGWTGAGAGDDVRATGRENQRGVRVIPMRLIAGR
jgi:hypothetical protein